MTGRFWWERDPARLAYELERLEAAGIAYEIDDESQGRGVLRLRLSVDVDGEPVRLVVSFPDLYPFFRFEVEAPDLALPYHQNPFGKNLCLIGRGTYDWHTHDTVAGLVKSQLPTVLQTARASDPEAARGREQPQAEPFGEYYPYAPSVVILGGDGALAAGHARGTFHVAGIGPQGPPTTGRHVRGVMELIRAEDGTVLYRAGGSSAAARGGGPIEGRWLRVSAPIAQGRPDAFLRELLEKFPFALHTPPNHVDGGWLQIWGVVFPEEDRWRNTGAEGWVFICLFNRDKHRLVRTAVTPRPRRGNGIPRKKGKGRRRS